jgi:hypothetical protein
MSLYQLQVAQHPDSKMQSSCCISLHVAESAYNLMVDAALAVQVQEIAVRSCPWEGLVADSHVLELCLLMVLVLALLV